MKRGNWTVKKKKVLQINAYYKRGSTGNIVECIENEGKKQGLDMYAIYWLQQNKKDASNVFFVGKGDNRTVIGKYFEWVFRGGRLNYNKELTIKIVEIIKKINPDIIHLHNLHGDFEYGTLDFCVLFEYLKESKKRIIWTLHDCWPITGRCYYFEYKKCTRWMTGCGKCPQRLFDRQGILCDHSAPNLSHKKKYYDDIDDMTIVTVSEWLHNIVNNSVLSNKRIKTIYNGVDTEVFHCKDKSISTNNKVLCIGWDRRKGFKDYYKLAKELGEGYEIVVVGHRPIFRRLRKLPSNIREIDYAKTKQEMADIYNSADVYFNSSRAETFGLTTVESMCCATPVVGYDSTATPELINLVRNGGMVADVGDVKQVKKIIYSLTQKKQLVNSEDCENYFNIRKMEERYIDLYMEG